MEAVLVRASIRTAAAISQAQGNGVQVKAILAERVNFAVPQVPTADATRKDTGQSGFGAPHRLTNPHTEMPGPLGILWNCGSDELFSISEERVQDEYTGHVNYETLDGSTTENNEDELDCDMKVSHTRESFAKFLRQVPATELKGIGQACYLSNLAYIIAEIKKDELQRDHRLRLVTSSIEKDSVRPIGSKQGKSEDMGMAPVTAYALAATASFLKSQRTTSTTGGESPLSSELLSRAVDHQLSSAVSSFMESPETSPLASVIDEVRREEASTSNSSPCGWFVCDEQETATRFFAIQGSESMASWKANLRFQPTVFEASKFGVMVHKGVYELAELLYHQMLPLVRSHMKAYGKRARISFTGHSLGGSLAVLLSIMLRCRGEVPVSSLGRVYTFGAPSVLNGGNRLLKRLGFPPSHIQSVVISRDLVPRVFACDIPEQIADLLKRVNQSFRNLLSFVNQRQLYSTTGQLLILQPEAQQAPGHPLLPSGSGLYALDLPPRAQLRDTSTVMYSQAKEVRAAERAFLNSPHPVDIMSDPSAYGSGGAICRDHDPRSYRQAVTHVLKQAVQGLQRRKRIDLRHLEDENSDLFAAIWPPSPVDTSKRSKRIADMSLFSNIEGFSGIPGAATSGLCNYLSNEMRKPLNTVALGQQTCTRSFHVLESHRQSYGSRYGKSVISRQH